MFSTLRLGRIFGIETKIHWSFWFLLIWIVLTALGDGGILGAGTAVGFVFAVFFCVYLHELGHALAARRYGIRTLDISILPIGGLARLETMPRNPAAEFWISIAGPAVNFIIAFGILCFLGVGSGLARMSHLIVPHALVLHRTIFEQLIVINLVLGIFNLLPALPMDGGRILRSTLQFWMNRLRATEVAARVSRYLAVVLMIAGMIYSWSLALVGVFVLVAGFQELMMTRLQSMQEQSVSNKGYPPDHLGPTMSFEKDPFSPIEADRLKRTIDGDDKVLDAENVRRIS